MGALTGAGDSLGLITTVLPEARPAAGTGERLRALTCPGFVNFTSGSTGSPKPVYISTRSFLVQTASIVEASPLSPGDPVVGSLQLSTHYGLGQALILPTVLGSALGLLERFDHRSMWQLLSDDRYVYWAAPPIMADVLVRATAPHPPPPVPPICHISAGRLSARTFTDFRARFGVTLRPSYGQTENGFICADTAPPEEIRPDCVGQAAPGIELRTGDDPRQPFPPGQLGRVWFKSPWYMDGYGFPPELAPRDGVDGWWPTADIGMLDKAGYLSLAGRADDCFKTAAGYLVNPGAIAHALTSHPAVVEVLVLPIRSAGGPLIGALVEVGHGLGADELRALAARLLPSWLQPQMLAVADRLPRLPGGKPDRHACQAILEARHPAGRAE